MTLHSSQIQGYFQKWTVCRSPIRNPLALLARGIDSPRRAATVGSGSKTAEAPPSPLLFDKLFLC